PREAREQHLVWDSWGSVKDLRSSPEPVNLPLPLKLMARRSGTAEDEVWTSDLKEGTADDEDTTEFEEEWTSAADAWQSATTLVVHSIPSRYTQAGLLRIWSSSPFLDFLHLPYRNNQRRSSHYAFVNFTSPAAAR
ncbi:unnamed protein product, partial [Polarella glacialis]